MPELVTETVNIGFIAPTRFAANFTVDGEAGGLIELEPGTIYVLDTTTLGPFQDYFALSTTPDGTHNGGVEYVNDSVVVRDAANNQIVIYANDLYANSFHYYDTMDPGMGGLIGDPPTVIQVTAAGGKYYMDGVEQGFVDLDPGTTYVFDVSDLSMAYHPLAFSTTEDGSHGGGAEYADADYSVAADGTFTCGGRPTPRSFTTTVRRIPVWVE